MLTQSNQKVFDRNVELSTNCNGSWQALIKSRSIFIALKGKI